MKSRQNAGEADEGKSWLVASTSQQGKLVGQLICAELNLHQMGLTSQVSAPENLASSGDQHAKQVVFKAVDLPTPSSPSPAGLPPSIARTPLHISRLSRTGQPLRLITDSHGMRGLTKQAPMLRL